MASSIQDRVLHVIATSKRLPIENVKPDSTFEALGIDSLDRLNILFDLESEFDIEIDDEDAKQVTGIPQMVEGISAIVIAKEAGLPAPHFPRAPQPASDAPATTGTSVISATETTTPSEAKPESGDPKEK